MIKIITLANLQLFLTKCKTLFASKKHTHTASEITGLPSGGGADSTRYTVDEHGYTVIKDKYGNDAFLANGVNRELRDSKGNTAVRVKNPEALPNDLGGGVEINYGKNANGDVEKAIVTSDSNLQIKTPDGNTVARIEDGKTSWKTPTSTTDAIHLTPTKSQLKFDNKGLEVNNSRATLTHAKEVLLNSEAGSGASLRLSEKDVHLDGIDGGMMVESREGLSGEIYYGMNLPLKNSSTDTNPTTQPIKGIVFHKTYVALTGPDNSIYGDAIYLGGGNSHQIDVDAGSLNFTNTDTTIQFNGYSIPSLFPNRAIPNIHSLLSQVTNAIISVPDEELTYGYMYDYSEEICVFHNESHTMYFLKDGDVIQPLSIPVFNSVEEALVVLGDDKQLLYAKNPNTGLFDLMYNSGVSGSGFEMVYLDEYPQESVGYDKIVNITNAFLKLKELSEKI